ncbi:hypothetical protein AAIB33_03380 [Microbacterium sp. AZCO]|uniref:hypothetical protein n=1 Tax=Microbacterium sp. AZCO TaxID=3142976 RepID=UPI0031F45901
MIVAGLILLAIGSADILREFLPARRRWIGLAAGAVAILVLAALSDAVLAGLLAVALAAAWVWLAPVGAPSRAGFWPAVAVGALCAVLVAALPARPSPGIIGDAWMLPTPVGDISFDHAVLALGAALFLLESSNVVVRAALVQEKVQVGPEPVEASPAAVESRGMDAGIPAREPATTESAVDDEATVITPLAAAPALKGGRLIGPLERMLVFALTLAAMYPLLAAILAAKGIVRFPEISRDSAAGNRAEYFLIGSLVSWVIALAAAFLVWWAFATP